MQTELVAIDSQIWGRNVLNIGEFSSADDIVAHETLYIGQYNPVYVSLAVDVDDIQCIQRLAHAGFVPVDCQLALRVSFRKTFETTAYRMIYSRVQSPQQLRQVLDIASELNFNDRFSKDTVVPPGFASRRYEAYLRQSFNSATDEIWAVVDPANNQILSFRSHRKVSSSEAQLLLGGVRKDLIGEGLGAISTHFMFNQMIASGLKRATTRISLANKPVFDLEVTHFGFRYQSAKYIFRKHYP